MSRKTPFRLLAASALLMAAAAHAPAAQAVALPLSDAEMSGVRGADGSIAAPVTALPGGGDSQLGKGLAAAFSSSTGPQLLDAAQFAAALQGTGWTPAMLGYDGQPVSQIKVDAPPVTFSFDLAQVFQTVGVSYHGPSMGTITMSEFDARGTTIWVWHH